MPVTEGLILNDSENMCPFEVHGLLKCALIYHLKASLYLQLTYFG